MDKISDNKHSGLWIILAAALLIALIIGVQYYYTRRIMGRELERRAENELTLKAILIKGNLNAMEYALSDHAREAARSCAHPDSMFTVVKNLLDAHPNIVGGGIGFVPNYYPDKGRLFEPWAGSHSNGNVLKDLAGPNHDYTTMPFYTEALDRKGIYWSDPYVDVDGGLGFITTAALPVLAANGDAIGVLGADVRLSWLGDTINSRCMYPSSFNLLLTEEGELIAGPPADSVDVSKVVHAADLINDSSVVRHKSQSGHTTIIRFTDKARGKASIIYAFMRGLPHWQLAVVCYDDEVYSPLRSMGFIILLLTFMSLSLLTYIVYRTVKSVLRLNQTTLQQERLNGELQTAKRIQADMLPVQSTESAGRNDIAVYGVLEAAKEVGGDLFDYFIRDEKLFFCIGDVSGKGVPSAMVMAVTHTLIRSASAHESNPARIMRSVNEDACSGNVSNMFVTLFIGVLDLPTGRLRFCNAGHDRPVVIGTRAVELDTKANIPIGLFNDFEYEGEETMVQPGSMLFLYTDGLTEARNPEGKLFGEDRMMEALDACIEEGLTPKKLLEKMNACMRSYIDIAEQSDDLTMLALRYTPQGERCLLHEQLVLDNDVQQVTQLGLFLKSLASRIGLENSLAANLRLAIEEAVVNVMQYAYPKGTREKIKLEADVLEPESTADTADKELLRIIISDEGVPFDPTEMPEADTSLSAEERPIGGLGIFLMRELMDSINYERNDGRNTLTLKKYIIAKPIKPIDNENNNQ